MSFGLKPSEANGAIYLLFLKGAANAGSPNNLQVTVVSDGIPVDITKQDIGYAYQKVTKNPYLRRLAEALAKEISEYAESQGLSGDLAKKINNRLQANQQNLLTPKERAWASSFCQEIPGLENLASDRLPSLLSQDYQSRFEKRTNEKSKKKSQTDNNFRPSQRKPVADSQITPQRPKLADFANQEQTTTENDLDAPKRITKKDSPPRRNTRKDNT